MHLPCFRCGLACFLRPRPPAVVDAIVLIQKAVNYCRNPSSSRQSLVPVEKKHLSGTTKSKIEGGNYEMCTVVSRCRFSGGLKFTAQHNDRESVRIVRTVTYGRVHASDVRNIRSPLSPAATAINLIGTARHWPRPTARDWSHLSGQLLPAPRSTVRPNVNINTPGGHVLIANVITYACA